MDEQEFRNLYPRMQKTGNELSPYVRLPKNFNELIIEFYKRKGQEYVEEFTQIAKTSLGGFDGPIDVRLKWDEQLGLTNISLGTHGGLDLEKGVNDEEMEFREHNLSGHKNGVLAFIIATAYVSRLIGNRR